MSSNLSAFVSTISLSILSKTVSKPAEQHPSLDSLHTGKRAFLDTLSPAAGDRDADRLRCNYFISTTDQLVKEYSKTDLLAAFRMIKIIHLVTSQFPGHLRLRHLGQRVFVIANYGLVLALGSPSAFLVFVVSLLLGARGRGEWGGFCDFNLWEIKMLSSSRNCSLGG